MGIGPPAPHRRVGAAPATAGWSRPLVGCIADDLTGAADIAATLSARGLSTELLIGPGPWETTDRSGASVIALKSRTAPTAAAVADSLASLRALRARGATRFIFKYCSTFDSTQHGNIGPVAEAL